MMTGRVIWITGLSGAGKSTLAHEVFVRLRAAGAAAVMLDGDELREVFGAVAANAQNHGREGRLALAMQYAHLCRVIAAQGVTVVIATISLFREVHAWNRANLPGYFEVYLKVPVAELRRRDPKGIYRRFDAGELAHVMRHDPGSTSRASTAALMRASLPMWPGWTCPSTSRKPPIGWWTLSRSVLWRCWRKIC